MFVAAHDRFHGVAADTMAQRHAQGTLLPSALDLRLRAVEEADEVARGQQQQLLLSTLDALDRSVASGRDETVDTTAADLGAGTVQVGAVDLSGRGWDAENAHEHDGYYSLSLSLHGLTYEDRMWAADVLTRFLAPNPDQQETIYDYVENRLVLSVILTNAELVQLLADRSPTIYEPGTCPLPPPTMLHYADRFAITRSFVNGETIRTVCGTWFIPRGDDHAHSNLPVCPDCYAELPAAQAIRDMLRARDR